MLTATVDLMNRILVVVSLVAACGAPINCTPAEKSGLPAAIEEIEEKTESFANLMLDLGVSLRNGSLVEIETALSSRILSDGIPQVERESRELHGWVLRRIDVSGPMSANAYLLGNRFLSQLKTTLDRWSELEDVRFKVKEATVTGDRIDANVAISIVGRDREGRRAWTSGLAAVHAIWQESTAGWRIDGFGIGSLETLVAGCEVFSEVAIPAKVQRTDPPFLARQGPPFAAYGAAVGDINNDGLIDLVVTSETGNSLYLNRGDGTFDDVAVRARVRDVHGDAVAPLLLDFDNDGDLDLFLSAIGDQMLFENRLLPDGRLEFWDISHESGVAVPAIGFSAVAGDIDGNGFPDIYVTSYNRYGQILPDHWDGATNGTPNLLFINQGNGSFAEAAKERGVADDRWGYAAGFADVDRDGDLDLYATNDFGGGNSLFINECGSFVDRAEENGVYDGGYGMGVSFGDFDNDGDLDLHVTRMSSTAGRRILARLGEAELPTRNRLEELALGNSLYENTGTGTFLNVSAEAGPFSAGWAWGGGFIDIDNDGYEDLFTPNGFISGSKLHDT
jgi:hypothetical protein